MAAGLLHPFSKVGEDIISKTRRRLAIVDHRIQALVIHPLLLLALIAILDEVCLDMYILPTVEQDALRLRSIASRTPRLLIV